MIKVYTGLKGSLITFFFIAAVILILSIFIWGMEKAVQLLLPLLVLLAYAIIVVFVFGVLPASFLKDMRPKLAVYSVLMSYALGAVTWMVAFFFVVNAFGVGGIFLALFFQFLAPIAIVGAMMKNAWAMAGHLSLWIAVTYAMRFYSQWLLKLNSPNQEKRDIIDVEAIEIVKKGTL